MSSDATATALVQVDQSIFDKAGKVIAVHLNYASRAAQRGRTPAQPVLLPQAVHLARRRPAAPSSARPAPSCSPSRARSPWSSAPPPAACRRRGRLEPRRAASPPPTTSGSTTCAYADKGSNVRSKGGDGFTPIGPGPASTPPRSTRPPCACAPGSTASSPRTTPPPSCSSPSPSSSPTSPSTSPSSPGDVILTGTPAGSSVVVPGDVVEVEVDAPTAAGLTTGRLVTTVTEGTDAVRRLRRPARGRRHAARRGLGHRRSRRPRTADHRQATGTRPPSCKAKLDVRRHRHLSGAAAQARPQQRLDRRRARPPSRQTKLVGTARTLRFVPNREDLFKTHGGGYNAQKRAFDAVGAGRGHRHRGPRRDGLRHPRRHPRPARPGARRRRHRHRRRRARPRRRRRARTSRSLARRAPRGARPQARAVGHRRHHRAAAAPPCSPATSSSATPTASSSSRRPSPRRSPTRRSRRSARTPSSPSRSPQGNRSTGLFPMNAEWKARYDAWVGRRRTGRRGRDTAPSKSQQAYQLAPASASPTGTSPPATGWCSAPIADGARHERRAGARGDPPARGRGPGHLRAQRRRQVVDGRRHRSTCTPCRPSASSRAPPPRSRAPLTADDIWPRPGPSTSA